MMIETSRMVANMWAGDIRNKTDVTVMGSDMVKTTNQLRNVMLT